MRTSSTPTHLGAAAAIALATACTAVIGVEDVELAPPDGPPAATCSVNKEFELVVSNPSTSVLSRRSSDGGPSLLFLLNTDAKPDALSALLYDNMGGHGVLNAPGTYLLSAADAKLETCGICLFVDADYDRSAGTSSQTFMALGQGTLTLTTATTTRMVGRLGGLKFRHVDISGSVTREIADGCTVAIDDVRFDMSYSQ